MQVQGTVGPQSAQSLSSGTPGNLRLGQMNDLIVSELHGKWYESAYRGNLYSVGMTATALSANTITLTNATTPIVGLWNPSTSTVNCVIAKAKLQTCAFSGSPVAPGAYVWATSTGNSAITTGIVPMNRKTLALAGSQAKGFNISTALSGLSNNLVIQFAAAFGAMVSAQNLMAAPAFSSDGTEEFDGSLIVPPGGVLALLNTVSTTTVSVASALLWEEVPI